MRVLVHDYTGHPFQVQLSRELARRGHDVLHLHCGSFRTGKGAVEGAADDDTRFRVDAVSLPREFEKYSPWTRLRQERAYGLKVTERLRDFRPEVVLSANTPLLAQKILLSECRRLGSKFVFWQQDILGIGIKRVLDRQYPVIGAAVGSRFVALERSLLLRSDAVVAISDGFLPALEALRIPAEKIHVIENWAPIEEMPVRPRENEWSTEHGLVGKRVLLYSGTLGLKHNPDLIVQLASSVRSEPDIQIVVVSEGLGAEWLDRRRSEQKLKNIQLLPFQPYAVLPDVLASGDILLAILEADAGVFSVPSKVLSYLCAGRPLLAAIPADNLAATVVRRSGGGIVVDPHDTDDFVAGARRLLGDEKFRAELGKRARRHAETTFDIARIADRFEAVLEGLRPQWSANQIVPRQESEVRQ
jgi:putative colanic acid biosynthesis glycosyltransferase WcaI